MVSQLDKLGQSIDYLRVPRLEPRTLTPIDTISQVRGEGREGQAGRERNVEGLLYAHIEDDVIIEIIKEI